MPARAEANSEKRSGDSEDVLRVCAELEVELNELKAKYDQYFLGLERQPPNNTHQRLRKQILDVKGKFIRQTAAKFRIAQLVQKLTTYERLWDRTIKEIEAGTYSRDLFKARRHRKPGGPQDKKTTAADDFQIDEDLDVSDLGGGEADLGLALAAAADAAAKPASAAASAAKPVTGEMKPVMGALPALKPITIDVKPVSGGVPAVKPVTGDVKPVTGGLPSVKPVTGGVPAVGPMKPGTADLPALRPSVPAYSGPSYPGAPRPSAPSAGAPSARPVSSPAVAASGRPSPSSPDGGLTDQKIRAIYDAYVMAKKRCGEDTRAVTLDSVSASLKKQVPELMKQSQAKTVEFKVVIRDGKAVLRALPKE